MSTYTPISSFVLGSATSTVTLNNIPGTYTDLILVAKFDRSVADSGSWFRINNDSGSNYSTTEVRGNGTNATSGRDTSVTVGRYFRGLSNSTTDNFFIMHLMDYANTTTNKTILTRGGQTVGTGTGTEANVNLWRSTAAITEINLITASGTYSAGSIFNLYGIQNAGLQAKASGGNYISTDGQYWYHTFTSSGTFTPTQSLTADYLVIAGGGGGAGQSNLQEGVGGGGAGGLRCTVGATGGGGSLESPLSLTAQAYTVTIGAGGTAGSGATAGTNGSNSVFSTITSTGGGVGARIGNTAGTGGSGGGAEYGTAGSGTANQGFAGANTGGAQRGGGGGGAGAAGSTGITTGAGGNGVTTSISGSSVTYAGGGGGGGSYTAGALPTGGAGGSGGGGAGGNGNYGSGTAGTINTGSGGGAGAGGNAGTSLGGAGGSGVVIVRYAV